MNRKLILSLSTVALLSTSLFANMPMGNHNMQNQGIIKEQQKKDMQKHPIQYSVMHSEIVLNNIMMLDLTNEQIKKIKEIINAKVENIINPSDAFTKDSFDKAKYLKTIEQNKEMVLKDRVEKLSKIYEILTKKQKIDLKTILDMEEIMQKKMETHKMHKQEFHR